MKSQNAKVGRIIVIFSHFMSKNIVTDDINVKTRIYKHLKTLIL